MNAIFWMVRGGFGLLCGEYFSVGEYASWLTHLLFGITVAISRYKHLHTNAPAHCYGEQCIEYHKMQLANTSVPVKFLKDTISLLEKQAEGIAGIMEELKLPHLKVMYERLYYARRAEQWMDIFRFVGVGPMSGLEMEHVRAVRFMKRLAWLCTFIRFCLGLTLRL